MERKAKQIGYVEPMPKKIFRKLEKEFNSEGGRFIMGQEIDEFLAQNNAEACTLNETTILFRKNVGRAAVYEELIHVTQFREGRNNGSYGDRLRNEIEAQSLLLMKAVEYNLTSVEIEQTKIALRDYEMEYDNYLKGGTK